MRWAPRETWCCSLASVTFMQRLNRDCNGMLSVARGFTSYLRQNWAFSVKRSKMASLLPSCSRQVIYSYEMHAYRSSNNLNLDFYSLNKMPLFPDDGRRPLRLHHDLQRAQWSFSQPAAQQELHTGTNGGEIPSIHPSIHPRHLNPLWDII